MAESQVASMNAQLNRFSELHFSQKSLRVGRSCKRSEIAENSLGSIPRLLIWESSYHKEINLYKQLMNRFTKYQDDYSYCHAFQSILQ